MWYLSFAHGLVLLSLVTTWTVLFVGAAPSSYTAVNFNAKQTKGDDPNLVNLKDEKSWIEWSVDLTVGGQATLGFRHSNTMMTTMNILVNQNSVITVDFPAAAASAATTVPGVPLSAGSNTIRLTPSEKGEIDVDKLLTVEMNADSPQDADGGPPEDNGNNPVHVIYSTDVPSGDHTLQIQSALDSLNANDATLDLIGDFVIFRTIYLPSDLTWRLDGTLSLGANAVLDILDWRPGAITEKAGGASNIKMSGGLYRGNRNKNMEGIRFLNFIHVQNSIFRDMVIVDASDDNFSLGADAQNNEVYNLVSRYAGGNGLTDKGSYNKWFDCVAEYCDSDGWTPKSQYSEYHRCIARENKGPGFGLYARTDVPDVNIGAKLNGNSFIEIEAYCNERSGISLNIAANCGPGAEIKDNHVQGYFYKNGRGGVEVTNKLPDGKIINNSMDLVAIENYGWSSVTQLGGISVAGEADGITGSFLGYSNNEFDTTDVNIREASNSALGIFQTSPMPQVVGETYMAQPSLISCPAQSTDEWRVRKYCERKLQPPQCVTKWKQRKLQNEDE